MEHILWIQRIGFREIETIKRPIFKNPLNRNADRNYLEIIFHQNDDWTEPITKTTIIRPTSSSKEIS